MSDQKYDIDKIAPDSTMSLANLRSNPEAIHQGDFGFLRPLTYLMVDDFEYSTDSAASAVWQDGAGLAEMTITSESSIVKFGNYSLKVVIAAVPTDEITLIMSSYLSDLSLMKMGQIYLRTSKTGGDTLKLRIGDSSGNESYWNLVISAADTWEAVSFDITSSDGNNGTDADLSDLSYMAFDDFEDGETYYFDNFKLSVGNTIVVDGASYLGSSSPYHSHSWILDTNNEITNLFFERTIAPEIILPTTSARWDLLVYDPSNGAGTISWIEGTEGSNAKPHPENYQVPICYVKVKTTQVKVVELWEADSNPNEGYIGYDCRNLMGTLIASRIGQSGRVIAENIIDIIPAMTETTSPPYAYGLKLGFDGVYFYHYSTTDTPSGTYMNKFSTDTTLAGNKDHTVVSEKAVKTYVDSLVPKHYVSPGKISMSGNNVVVEPRVLLIEGALLSQSADISKDVTVSGNYVGTDMSATEGYVYIYLKNDGAGGYSVFLSGDAPNRSDTSSTATTGNLIYRDFSSIWYTCMGVRYKSTTALRSFYVSDNGLVMFEDFIEVVDAGTGSIDADYDSKLPSIINFGLFSVEMTTQAGDAPRCKIRPKDSTGDYFYVSSSPTVTGVGGGQIWCHTGTDNKIRVVIDKSTSSTAKIELAGYNDIR